MWNLVPIRRMSSRQKVEVKMGSRSDTSDSDDVGEESLRH